MKKIKLFLQKRKQSLLSLPLFFLINVLFISNNTIAQTATVATNKSDYSPGQYVIVTGSHWLPGETVKLTFTETPLIHPAEDLFATADGAGNISNNEYLIALHDIGQSFTLVATGQTSGKTATAAFTDGPPNPSADIDQFYNDAINASPTRTLKWINQELNPNGSHYAESMSVPYRMVMKNLSVNTVATPVTHTLIIKWDITKGGKHAFDYITSYNNIDNPPGYHLAAFGHSPETIDPLLGLTGTTFSGPSTFAIPAPAFVAPNLPLQPQPQPITSFNALPVASRPAGFTANAVCTASSNPAPPATQTCLAPVANLTAAEALSNPFLIRGSTRVRDIKLVGDRRALCVIEDPAFDIPNVPDNPAHAIAIASIGDIQEDTIIEIQLALIKIFKEHELHSAD